MGVLDQINQMKGMGSSEQEIISKLQEQGVAPKTINDALSQSQIKTAVAGENLDPTIRGDVPPEPPVSGIQGQYTPQARELQGSVPQQQDPPEAPIEEEYYSQEEYPQQGGYGGYSSGMGTDNFMEIAEQVFAENIKKLSNQLESVEEFKALTQVKLDHALERIKRIEDAMDKLQMAILDKVGAYGNTLESIRKEMGMMQDSFGKIVKNSTTSSSNTITKIKKK